MAHPLPRPFFIVGPTASGKSAVALELALRCRGEVVNADAFQLYRGMDILTAKPAAEDRARVRHHLYGVVDPGCECDAASYAAMAGPILEEIAGRGRLPVVAGGSGLYVKALTHGLSPMPAADEGFRRILREVPLERQVEWLRRMDPVGVQAMDLHNPRYVERALEITVLSGRPASSLKAAWKRSTPSFSGAFLSWERQVLYARINARTLAMAEAGLVAEVAALPTLSATAEKAIGIREIRAHLAGHCSLQAALAAMQQATRRYAKRQCTWFQREKGFQSVCLGGDGNAKSAVDRILACFPELLPS